MIGRWSKKAHSKASHDTDKADWRDDHGVPSFGALEAVTSKPRQLFEDDEDIAPLLDDTAEGENDAPDDDTAAELEPNRPCESYIDDDDAGGKEENSALEHSATGRIGANRAHSDEGKARQKAARKAFEERISDIERAMESTNARLSELAGQIRSSQPKSHGAVLLQLSNCGRGCMGCPHPRWQKWVNRKVENPMLPASWFAVNVKSPMAATRKLEYTQETRDLIQQGVDLLGKKRALVKALNSVNQVIKQRKMLPG